MSLYEGIKDIAKVVQQADNLELYKKLLDLGEQALDMQAEIAKLQAENIELCKKQEQQEDVIPHKTTMVDSLYSEYPYITLRSDSSQIRYCAICWGRDKKLIPLYDELNCVVCLERKRT